VNHEEVGLVLAKLAAFDQRTVGEVDILAWHEVISRFSLDDCLAAVTTHYTESRERAMPADISRIVIRIGNTRVETRRTEDERLALDAAPAGRSEATAAFVQAVVDALPKPDIHERALARARSERGRPEPASRQPKTKRKPPKDYPEPATDDVAAMATRYLLDGHEPRSVADRLAVSRRWCERTIRRLRPTAEGATP
jgi:hypothetical protein